MLSKHVISRMLRNFHEGPDYGYEPLYRRVINTNSSVLRDNESNVGAEFLFAMFSNTRYASSYTDTDADGLPELADKFGDPLVFLTDELPEDFVIHSDGYGFTVTRPPYCNDGFYLSMLRLHPWLPGDAEALEDSRRRDEARRRNER